MEDVPSSVGSKTPSEENASTHPQLDNLPTQHWSGLSVSSENPEQLSDPFSKKDEADSLAGGDASERSSLLSGVESDRKKDLDDMDSDGGPNPPRDRDENDTPRTIDADLDDDLEAAGDIGTPRSTTSADGQDKSKEDSNLRTIDVDMRSVSQINTEHEDGQSIIESQISDKVSVKSSNDHNEVDNQISDGGANLRQDGDENDTPRTIDADLDDDLEEAKVVAEDMMEKTTEAAQVQPPKNDAALPNVNEQSAVEPNPEGTQTSNLEEGNNIESTIQNPISAQELYDEEENASMDGTNSEDFATEKDILTGSQKGS